MLSKAKSSAGCFSLTLLFNLPFEAGSKKINVRTSPPIANHKVLTLILCKT